MLISRLLPILFLLSVLLPSCQNSDKGNSTPETAVGNEATQPSSIDSQPKAPAKPKQKIRVVNEPLAIADTVEAHFNHRDSLGRRQGLWQEPGIGSNIYNVKYKNDVMYGTYKCYSRKTGLLIEFGEYQEGKRVGEWYYFRDIGPILKRETILEENTTLKVRDEDGALIAPDSKSYIKEYHDNGMMAAEGLALYDYVIFGPTYYRYGKWKYYNKDGKLMKTENYSTGKVIPTH